jgi:hypothetical protein
MIDHVSKPIFYHYFISTNGVIETGKLWVGAREFDIPVLLWWVGVAYLIINTMSITIVLTLDRHHKNNQVCYQYNS